MFEYIVNFLPYHWGKYENEMYSIRKGIVVTEYYHWLTDLF